jgi:DnaJ-class molecular chaperone
MDFERAKRILELENNFTPDQLKQNYHRLSLKFHPDKGGNPEDFVQLSQAYQILQTENVENVENIEKEVKTSINLNDVFRTFIKPIVSNNLMKVKSFFGFKKEITVDITAKEFLEGTVKEVEELYKLNCGCDPQFCDRCRGFTFNVCNKCNGTGITFCGRCVSGFTNHTRKIKVNITSLKSIVLENLIIHVELKEKKYFVKDDKLYYNYNITLKDSLIGFEKTFKDPFDFEHTITSNSIIKQNDGYFISKKVFLLFNVVYPKKLSKSVIKQLKQIDF